MGALLSTLVPQPWLALFCGFVALVAVSHFIDREFKQNPKSHTATPTILQKSVETQTLFQELTEIQSFKKFLETHISQCRQVLETAEELFLRIGPASYVNSKFRLRAALELRNILLVTIGKLIMLESHYDKNVSMYDVQNRYKMILAELHKTFQALETRCKQTIMDLLEIQDQKRNILETFCKISTDLEAVDGNNAPVSAESDADDVVLSKLVELQVDINSCEEMMQKFTVNYRFSFDLPLAPLKKRIDASWERRSSKIKDLQIAQLQTMAQCGICITNKKEVALTCGHQLCESCLDKITDCGEKETEKCPFCRQPLQVAVRLY